MWEVTLVLQLMSQPTNCYNLTAHHIKIYCLPHTEINLTLLKKLLRHDGLCQLLEHAWNNGQKALIHWDTEKICLRMSEEEWNQCWWDTLFMWSPTVTKPLNQMLHPITTLLISIALYLLLNTVLCVRVWRKARMPST